MKNEEIINGCIKKYGSEMQKIIAIEECSELIQAITKDLRYHSYKNLYSITEELADVKICIETLIMIYSVNCPEFRELINETMHCKFMRMEYLLTKEVKK